MAESPELTPRENNVEIDKMKIVVCCKAVPQGITKIKFAQEKGIVECESFSLPMNESDEYALEQALVLKKECNAEITVLTLGCMRTQDMLYLALAKGADRAIRIDAGAADSGVTCEIIAQVVRKMEYDLILTGVESHDNMSAQVGICLAERLGLPFVLAVTELKVAQNNRLIKVTKELGGGIRGLLEITMPALLCIQSGIQPLSGVALIKILRVRREKSVGAVRLADLGMNWGEMDGKRSRIVDVFDPPRASYATIIDGTPKEVARVLVNKMREVLR